MDKTNIKPVHAKPSIYAFYFEIIKEIGKEFGYNIVLHGSLNRDLDLIAIPWQPVLYDKMAMLNKIAEAIGGYILNEDQEQMNANSIVLHGREQYVINVNRSIKQKYNGLVAEFIECEDPQYYIDISVLPVGGELLKIDYVHSPDPKPDPAPLGAPERKF